MDIAEESAYLNLMQNYKKSTQFTEAMQEFSYELRVPKDRVAVLIGKDGATKKIIESETRTKVLVDSKEGDVTVTGSDALSLYTAKEIINAIARGFNPDIALMLLKQDIVLEMMPLRDYAKTKDHLLRVKGRVIGAEGKSRRVIEELTESYISVYGKTIGIIGLPEGVAMARQAITSLLAGSPHSKVYRWLEKRRVTLKHVDNQ